MPSPYDNETYLQSLDASQTDINRQVENAIAEIQRRQEMAQAQLGLAGQETEGIFGAALGDFQGSLNDLQGNFGQYGGLFDGMSAMDPTAFQQAMSTLRSGWGEARGALGQGFVEQGNMRRSQANVLHQEMNRDVETQRQQYIAQRMAEDRARQEAESQANFGRIADLGMVGAAYGGAGASPTAPAGPAAATPGVVRRSTGEALGYQSPYAPAPKKQPAQPIGLPGLVGRF
jgi:hypothetical protein